MTGEATADDALSLLLFGHERDLLGNLRRFPLIARYNLDRLGLAISLEQWQALDYATRREIALFELSSQEQTQRARVRLQAIAVKAFGAPLKAVVADPAPAEYGVGAVLPERLVVALEEEFLAVPSEAQWQAFSELSRFGLLKLSRHGHRNRRLEALVFDLLGSQHLAKPNDTGSERSI